MGPSSRESISAEPASTIGEEIWTLKGQNPECCRPGNRSASWTKASWPERSAAGETSVFTLETTIGKYMGGVGRNLGMKLSENKGKWRDENEDSGNR